MTTLLHIDASLDRRGSATRRLSGDFVERWAQAHPEATILRRDLARDPAPVLTETFVRAVKTPPDRRSADERLAWQVSETLSDEFLSADRYVIGMPMHILTVPSSFKAYVEQIFHEPRVFRMAETGFTGLLGGRKFLFFVSKGADYRPGAPLAGFDMLEPYLRALLTFCGVDRDGIAFITVNNALSPDGPDAGDERQASGYVARLVETW